MKIQTVDDKYQYKNFIEVIVIRVILYEILTIKMNQ